MVIPPAAPQYAAEIVESEFLHAAWLSALALASQSGWAMFVADIYGSKDSERFEIIEGILPPPKSREGLWVRHIVLASF